MYYDDPKPLKRPKLGPPDIYPQETRQREDEITERTVQRGFENRPVLGNEYGTALNDFDWFSKNQSKDVTNKLETIMVQKRKAGWIQDINRKRTQLTKDMFHPIALMNLNQKKQEALTTWFQNLAGNKSLTALQRHHKVPILTKKEEIFDLLCENCVPMSRASWFIKMTAAYAMMNDSRVRKKQLPDPSQEWTLAITCHLQDVASKLLSRPAALMNDGGAEGDGDNLSSQAKWRYMVRLSSWLFSQGLLDHQEFLKWLVDYLEMQCLKNTHPNEEPLKLLLPLVLQFLDYITKCVTLCRPLVKVCVRKYASFYKQSDNISSYLRKLWYTDQDAVTRLIDGGSKSSTVEEADSTSSPLVVVPTPKGGGKSIPRTLGRGQTSDVSMDTMPPPTIPSLLGKSSDSAEGGTKESASRRQSLTGDGEQDKLKAMDVGSDVAMATEEKEISSSVNSTSSDGVDVDLSAFSWCDVHKSLMETLIYIFQTVAIRCTSALVALPTKNAPPSSLQGKTGTKVFRPLDVLPVQIHEMPVSASLCDQEPAKIQAKLKSIEEEIAFRSKCVESGWSPTDQQSPSEGVHVKRTLQVLEILDGESFIRCISASPVSNLIRHLKPFMTNSQMVYKDDQFVMLLCQWAITPHRDGQHRPFVAAQLIKYKHDMVAKKSDGAPVKMENDEQIGCCSTTMDDLEESSRTTNCPFQDVLFRFLSTHAPDCRGSKKHETGENPFFLLMILFGELIKYGVFSFQLYISKLLAHGHIVSPVIPDLMVGKEVMTQDEGKEIPSLTISIPCIKREKPSQSTSGSIQGKPSMSLQLDSKKVEPVISSPTAPSTCVIAAGSTRPSDFSQLSAADSNPDLLQKRHLELQRLLANPGTSDPFDSAESLGNSPTPDTTMEGFSPSHLSSPIQEKHYYEVTGPPITPLAKCRNTHHSVFAAYMPLSPSLTSRKVINERLVVLAGIGKGRSFVLEQQSKFEQAFLEFYYSQTSNQNMINWAGFELSDGFQKLPLFYKRAIAARLDAVLHDNLVEHQYPSVAQLCLTADVMEQAGDLLGLMELLVDLVAAGRKSESRKKMSLDGSVVHPLGEDWMDGGGGVMPSNLCSVVSSLFQRFLTCLFLSEHNTCVVFESLCSMLSGCSNLNALNLSHKAVFYFLYNLYQSCQYIQSTYRNSLQDGILSKLKDRMRLPPTLQSTPIMIMWTRTILVTQLAEPASCDINQLGTTLNSNPKMNGFTFICEALSLTCTPSGLSWQKIIALAKLVAEICCICHTVPPGILAALIALSLPYDTSYGFQQLATSANVHYPNARNQLHLLMFLSLMVAHNTLPLTDVIGHIVRPLIRAYLQSSSSTQLAHSPTNSILSFLTSLILLLLVDPHCIPSELSDRYNIKQIFQIVPTFVNHQLQSRRRELGLSILLGLLKELLKIAQPRSSRDTTLSGRSGMQIHVQTQSAVSDVRLALETLASQRWLGEICHRDEGKFLGRFGDTSITPVFARYLLMHLCPIESRDSEGLSRVDQTDIMNTQTRISYILRNLDQWTVRSSLLHISILITQTPQMGRSSLLDSLAGSVIQVFEDSCSEELLGQPLEMSQSLGDGAYSPPIWLVTPIITKLSSPVLGRVLKNAGNVLGRGQWWSLEKNLEKKRTTRQTNTSVVKYGLQWQQPFLELVLACMGVQRHIHEELLNPLQKQLQNFLVAFEKEGFPSEEMAKSTLHAALKLRLSLLGSMLSSIKESEAHCGEWAIILLQLLVSGAVDRQSDNNELFTSTVDMVSTLLNWLPNDFLVAPPSYGEESKRAVSSSIRKLKADLATSKSSCVTEIAQLFPLPMQMMEISTVKTPSWVSNTALPEKIRGLRVSDTKEVSPWECMEGVRNYGPLYMSWFGAVRIEKKPLKYVEQFRLSQLHSHSAAPGATNVVRADPAELEQAKAQASKDNKDTAPGNPSVPVTPVEGQPVRLPTPTHTQMPLGTHGGTPSHVGYPRHPPPTVGGTAHPPIPGYSQGHLPPAHQVYSRGAMGQRMPHSNHMQQRQLVHPQVNVPYQRPAFSQQVVRQHHPGVSARMSVPYQNFRSQVHPSMIDQRYPQGRVIHHQQTQSMRQNPQFRVPTNPQSYSVHMQQPTDPAMRMGPGGGKPQTIAHPVSHGHIPQQQQHPHVHPGGPQPNNVVMRPNMSQQMMPRPGVPGAFSARGHPPNQYHPTGPQYGQGTYYN